MPRWNYDNSERIFTDAGNIARRLEAGQVTVTALLKEYHCTHRLFKQTMTKVLGEAAYRDLLGPTPEMPDRAEQRRIEAAIAELKMPNGRRTVWWCLGCGHEIENTDQACPKCGGRDFEVLELPAASDDRDETEKS